MSVCLCVCLFAPLFWRKVTSMPPFTLDTLLNKGSDTLVRVSKYNYLDVVQQPTILLPCYKWNFFKIIQNNSFFVACFQPVLKVFWAFLVCFFLTENFKTYSPDLAIESTFWISKPNHHLLLTKKYTCWLICAFGFDFWGIDATICTHPEILR